MTVQSAGERVRGGAVLIGALALASVGSGLYLPLALVYFLALTDVPLATLGILLGAASAVALPMPTVAGMLVDRFGAKRVVVASLALQGAAFIALTGVAEPVGIFFASMLGAVGNRLYWSSIFALVAEVADGSGGSARTDDWFAWANIARTVGIGVGGLVTGLVVANGTDAAYRAVVLAAAVCFALATVAIAVIVRVPRNRAPDFAARGNAFSAFRDARFMALTALNVVFGLSTLMLSVALPTFVMLALEGPAWLTSSLLAGNAVLVLLLGAVIVRIVAPLRRTRVLVLGAVGWIVWSLGLAAIAHGAGPWVWAVLIAATLIFTVSELLHAPASMAIAASVGPADARGRYLATFQYSWVVAEIIAPVLFATFFAAGHALPFIAIAVLNALAICATLVLEKKLPQTTLRS